MNVNFSEMTETKLRRCGADAVKYVMGTYIRIGDVIPLESSPRKLYYRIGHMYFDLIVNDPDTLLLYVGNEDDVSIQIAVFNADGTLVRG